MRRRSSSWLAVLGSGCLIFGSLYGEPLGKALDRSALSRTLTAPLQRGAAHSARYVAASLGALPMLWGSACPRHMVLVHGEFCPVSSQRCLRYVDPQGSALFGQRCAEYEEPTRCKSEQRVALRYCIDKDEYTPRRGDLPQTQVTASEARSICRSAGKRLCSEQEWTFACEGAAGRPYPYGFARDTQRCNADQVDLIEASGRLKDFRAPAGAHPLCTSVFGVRDMTGNVEEYVASDSDPTQVVRRGAYWQPAPNGCRAAQPPPSSDYKGLELGFRCCTEARGG